MRTKKKGVVPAYYVGQKYVLSSLKEVREQYVEIKTKRIGFV